VILKLGSNQEVFDTVVAHLRKQGRVSMGAFDTRAYLGFDGTKCAVGCLIPDDQYTPSLEGRNILDLVGSGNVVLDPEDTGGTLGLLYALQIIHDTDPTTEWELKFGQTAQEFGIAYTPKN